MLDRIMVPVDGSPFGAQVLPFAQQLAKDTGAELHLVHVQLGGDAFVREQRSAHLLALTRAAAVEGVSRTRGFLIEGAVVDALLRYAEEFHPDLVVMATHGRAGIARAVLGSVAEAVVRECGAPVLAVRARRGPNGSADGIHRVLIPIDISDGAMPALAAATGLAQALGASCTLMHVVAPHYIVRASDALAPHIDSAGIEGERADAAAYLDRVAVSMRARGISTNTVVTTHELPAVAILERAAEMDADMIAMTTHGRTGWERLAVGSVAESVLRHARIPVLLATTGTAQSQLLSDPVRRPAPRSTRRRAAAVPPETGNGVDTAILP